MIKIYKCCQILCEENFNILMLLLYFDYIDEIKSLSIFNN